MVKTYLQFRVSLFAVKKQRKWIPGEIQARALARRRAPPNRPESGYRYRTNAGTDQDTNRKP